MTTIKVKPWGDGQGDHVLINEADFDPAKHELFGAGAVQAASDIAAFRAEYEARFGKRPFMGWDADELRKRIAEAGE
jgi:hypothetical protein